MRILAETGMPSPETTDEPRLKTYACYLGSSRAAGDYDELFIRRDSFGRSRISWNWAAFFFGGAWLAYRKMYGAALIYLVTVFALALAAALTLSPVSGRVLSLIIPSVCLAMVGNQLLHSHVKAKVRTPVGDASIGFHRPAVGATVRESPTSWIAGIGFVILAPVIGVALSGAVVAVILALSPTAQYLKGWSYAKGSGVSKNDAEAVRYYLMAAKVGYAPRAERPRCLL
jgi:TPR repeat protein